VRMGPGCPRGFHRSSLGLTRGSPRGSVSGVSQSHGQSGVHLDLGRACPLKPPLRFALSVYLSPRCPSLRCPFLLSLPTRPIPSLNPYQSPAYSCACRWRRSLATFTPSLPGPSPVAWGSSFRLRATQPRGRPLCSSDLATVPAADVLGWVSSAGPSILGPSP
jgi:hypothetical protein